MLEESGVIHERDYHVKKIEEAIGNRLFVTTISLTDQVIDLVDTTISSLPEAAEELTLALKEIWPDEQVIGMSVEMEKIA